MNVITPGDKIAAETQLIAHGKGDADGLGVGVRVIEGEGVDEGEGNEALRSRT